MFTYYLSIRSVEHFLIKKFGEQKLLLPHGLGQLLKKLLPATHNHLTLQYTSMQNDFCETLFYEYKKDKQKKSA